MNPFVGISACAQHHALSLSDLSTIPTSRVASQCMCTAASLDRWGTWGSQHFWGYSGPAQNSGGQFVWPNFWLVTGLPKHHTRIRYWSQLCLSVCLGKLTNCMQVSWWLLVCPKLLYSMLPHAETSWHKGIILFFLQAPARWLLLPYHRRSKWRPDMLCNGTMQPRKCFKPRSLKG